MWLVAKCLLDSWALLLTATTATTPGQQVVDKGTIDALLSSGKPDIAAAVCEKVSAQSECSE